MLASQIFDLDKFIENNKDLDYLDIHKSLNMEIRTAESVKIPYKSQHKRDIQYLQDNYISNLKGFSYLIGQGHKPAGLNKETLIKFHPILASLVNKKQLKETILKLIE